MVEDYEDSRYSGYHQAKGLLLEYIDGVKTVETENRWCTDQRCEKALVQANGRTLGEAWQLITRKLLSISREFPAAVHVAN